jgi:hypothetical protein
MFSTDKNRRLQFSLLSKQNFFSENARHLQSEYFGVSGLIYENRS